MKESKKLKKKIRKILKKKMWLVLSVVDENNTPHSSVVVYQSNGEVIYIQTGTTTLKAKAIRNNINVSVTIPFRKNFLHKLIPAPPAELHFTAKAKIVSKENLEAKEILKKFIKAAENVDNEDETIWIKITPSRFISTYGVGVPIWKMRKPEEARNLVQME
ncbi:MAG: hypothetical protein GF317_09000 [Candidatus Lokiarchaeota archaeon]|nr:hypothetical protein [Candidatus Lokiarchaeota archaeon]MBD3199849.1 hypothetical protein [Candidatus Lokiarchaeota archaeon]